MQRAGLGSDDRAFLDEALAHPLSPGEIARNVAGNSQLAAQVVAAASLVLDPANATEELLWQFRSRCSRSWFTAAAAWCWARSLR
jgi:uncharacterized membrane protein YebE (DUF533 family)